MKKLLFAVTALAMIAVSCKDIQEEIEMEVECFRRQSSLQ